MHGIPDEKLNDIVNDIGTDKETLIRLGLALGFKLVDVQTYSACNHQNEVSPAGTRKMLFDWRRDIRPADQIRKLREVLIKAKLTEIGETYLTASEDNVHDTESRTFSLLFESLRLQSSLTTSKKAKSCHLLCLKCNRNTAMTSDIISTKVSNDVEHSKVRHIMGKECLVQLQPTDHGGRYDIITLTTADVKICGKVFNWAPFEGYTAHRGTNCKGCSEQVGWYYIPNAESNLEPFHALWLQKLIHDSYDSDNTVNAFVAAQMGR